jgi:hypothetical protein
MLHFRIVKRYDRYYAEQLKGLIFKRWKPVKMFREGFDSTPKAVDCLLMLTGGKKKISIKYEKNEF